jgi:ATP-dependent DNA ligase
LNRYFPELEKPLLDALPRRCVLDGEIVIVQGDSLDFDALQPAVASGSLRVKQLSQKTPASFVFFDLLCEGESDLRDEPFEKRRRELEKILALVKAPVHLTPATRDRELARDWFRRFEGQGSMGWSQSLLTLGMSPESA